MHAREKWDVDMEPGQGNLGGGGGGEGGPHPSRGPT